MSSAGVGSRLGKRVLASVLFAGFVVVQVPAPPSCSRPSDASIAGPTLTAPSTSAGACACSTNCSAVACSGSTAPALNQGTVRMTVPTSTTLAGLVSASIVRSPRQVGPPTPPPKS